MRDMVPLLCRTALFKGFSREELDALFASLKPACRHSQKGETLLMAGEQSREIGVVIAGRTEAYKLTRGGQQFIVARMGPGGVFGDVLAGSHTKSPVSVVAKSDCSVLYLPFAGMMQGEGELYRRLLANLVGVIADKYFVLDARIDLLLIHGLRRRIAAYLLSVPRSAPDAEFIVPYTRGGLAGYLGCERSALSREISHMVAEGLIETERSCFRIPDEERLLALF